MIYATSAHGANNSLPYAFRTYPANINVIPDCPIWKALRASTAHPEMFKGIEIKELGVGYWFTGGAHGCGNPTPLLLKDAGALFSGRSVASITSIGAGYAGTIRIHQPSWLGRVLPIGRCVRSHRNAQKVAYDIGIHNNLIANEMAVRLWCEGDIYYRLSVDQGIQFSGALLVNEWEKQNEVASQTMVYLEAKKISVILGKLVASIWERRTSFANIENGTKILDISQI